MDYTQEEKDFLAKRGITVPESGNFQPGKDCPGEEHCYGLCFGTQGFASFSAIKLPCGKGQPKE